MLRGLLIILAFVFTWVGLYQGIVAFGSPPVRDDELVSITGVLRHAQTPLMRNRRVAQALLDIEISPGRIVGVPMPLSALPLEDVLALVGGSITVRYAGLRPRNRWIYDLRTEERHVVRLDAQRLQDAVARAAHVRWMLGLGFVAALFFLAALYPRFWSSTKNQKAKVPIWSLGLICCVVCSVDYC